MATAAVAPATAISSGAARALPVLDWLLVATVQGRGYVTSPTGRQELARGDILLIAPSTPQQYGHPDDNNLWINFWVHFQPRDHWLPWLAWPKLSKNVMLHSTGDRIRDVEAELRRMVEIAHGPSQLSRDASMNRLERVLIWAHDFNPTSAFSKLDDRIRRAVEIIGERLKDRLTVESLCREIGLSRSRFTLLFNTLQCSTLPVSLIAEEVGFRTRTTSRPASGVTSVSCRQRTEV